MDCGKHLIGETVINGEVKGQLVVGIGYGKIRNSRFLGIKLARLKYAGKQEQQQEQRQYMIQPPAIF